VLTPMPHEVPVSCEWLFVATQAPGYVTMAGAATPEDALKFKPALVRSVVYFAESEKNDSCELTRLRRSDFMAVMYAFDFVFANFGIAIAAKMPMMTTTISSSMRVKP